MYRLVARRPCRRCALRADRSPRLLARRARARVAGGARDHELLHARRPRSRHPGHRRGDVAIVGEGPVFLTVDVDVLDPAFAPGTGTPEPGGMTSADLLWACREIASRLELVGMDVVEVIPTGVGFDRHHRARRRADRPRGAHRHRRSALAPARLSSAPGQSGSSGGWRSARLPGAHDARARVAAVALEAREARQDALLARVPARPVGVGRRRARVAAAGDARAPRPVLLASQRPSRDERDADQSDLPRTSAVSIR